MWLKELKLQGRLEGVGGQLGLLAGKATEGSCVGPQVELPLRTLLKSEQCRNLLRISGSARTRQVNPARHQARSHSGSPGTQVGLLRPSQRLDLLRAERTCPLPRHPCSLFVSLSPSKQLSPPPPKKKCLHLSYYLKNWQALQEYAALFEQC